MHLIFFFILTLTVPFQLAFADKADSANQSPEKTLWSPLTPIEIATLNHASQARAGEPDALLALAIFASGDERSQADYEKIKHKIRQFIEQLRPVLNKEKNEWRKGLKLFLAMHNAFFLNNAPGEQLKGYRANQSQFSQIFRDKTYNCISSTILYLILARYFDLQVEAVILPSHSFVQLTTSDRQTVDIETTSETGYGLHHSQQFYSDNALLWSQYRNLPPSSYKDYLSRNIVSIFQIITENMNNQHTSIEQMSEMDRNRLYEARAWLLPDNPEAQLARLTVFNNELIRLKEKQEDKKTLTLIKIAEHVIETYYLSAIKNNNELSDDTYQMISFIYTRKAELALNNKDYAGAVKSYNEAIKWTRSASDQQMIQNNIAISWLNQGNTFFNKKDYASAIQFYKRAYSKNISKDLKQKIDGNIGSSYWNMSVPYLNKGDSYTAYEVLSECLSKYPDVQQCRNKLKTICSSYSLPDCSNQ
jgi:tetratricopeptide (TPR) repeat protein